jgi:peptidoglycan/xylan/chitin deacetylase (PgdA/CDA1 family)
VVPERLRGRDLERLPVEDKLAALTFDAGANADGVPSVLATLKAAQVPATFFLKGRFVETYPRKSARIARRHLVGNHTMNHVHLTALTRAEIRAEVRSAQRVITATTGEDPRRFFRFPFGARDPRVIRIVNRLCYVPFRWTVDTLGWKGTSGGQSVDSVVQRVVDARTRGMIVLMHVGSHPEDGSTLDADALPEVIERLTARGYTFVRLSRIMSARP